MNDSDPGEGLARWAAQGDRAALERALAAAANPARAQALRLLGRAADADDATQEALVQLVRSARRYDPARPFRPWLARLVHDACCRLLRSDRRRRRHEAAAPPPAPAVEPAVDAEAVRAAVLALPEPLRAAVDLHYFAGLSQAEAAEALGIGEGACAMRLSRARERLRTLLPRHGVGITAGAALTLLAATPASAAAPTLATGIAAQAAAGTLPATTIPLTPLQTGTWFMATHPLATTALALGLTAAALSPLALTAVEAPAPVQDPVQGGAAGYVPSASARTLLPFLDPAAPLRLALDLETLRPQLRLVRPFTVCDDPALAPLLDEGRAWLERPFARQGDARVWWSMAVRLAGQGGAATLALRDASQGRRLEQRILALVEAGPAAAGIAAAFEDMRRGKSQPDPATLAPAGPFTALAREGGTMILGQDRTRFAIAADAWLGERLAAAPAGPPPAAAWFRCDLTPLVAAMAATAAKDRRGHLAALLGEHWSQARPVWEGTIGVDGQDLVAECHGSDGAGPCVLVPALGFLQQGLGTWIPTSSAAWPQRPPRLGIPASPDALASLSLGLVPPADGAPLTRVERGWRTLSARQRRELVQRSMLGGWSGDAAAEVRPGPGLPRIALVLGLRPGADAMAAARQLAVMLGLPEDGSDAPAALPFTIAGGAATGQPSITAHSDRLVLTWNAGPEAWPGIATGAAGGGDAVCAARADLPAAVRACWPLLRQGLPEEMRRRLPPAEALAVHLPVWSMSARLVAGGWRIEERGLPLATVSTALASMLVVANSQLAMAKSLPPPTAEQLPAAKPAPGPAPEPAPAF